MISAPDPDGIGIYFTGIAVNAPLNFEDELRENYVYIDLLSTLIVLLIISLIHHA